jgi:Fe-S-cluster containining protein
MPDSDDTEEPDLVATRACGECNVCCTALTIDDPELQKIQGYRCPHSQPDHGCGIYATRPHTCRAFFCGWRRLKWIRESLRPDRSGVLVRLHGEVSHETGARRMGVMFTLLNNASLKAEGLAESVAAAIAADVPVYLHIPGPPGYTAAQVRINEVLHPAVRARDKEAVLDILRRVRARGRSGPFKPIVLQRGKAGTAPQMKGMPDTP